MQDIIDALPAAAAQLSDMIGLLFSSGIALIVVPLILIELIMLVFKVVRGHDD